MSPYDIAAALTAVTDEIGAIWDGDRDLQYCLEGVEDRLTALIARIYQEGEQP
ncbi:hypothetical protein [Actinoallomurus sp. CA-142502]|uniref:hypothetical protein n=1 Tax=Actinoallomurus sp. CA-142502 TaxID=3239885 RepID=UPI003D8B8612